MSRSYGKIDTSLWRSRKFASLGRSSEADRARLLYLYLHTCPHGNSSGVFYLPEAYAAADLSWSEDEVRNGIDTLSIAYLIRFDTTEKLLQVVDFLKHDPPSNPKHSVGLAREIKKLPDCEIKLHVINDLLACRNIASREIMMILADEIDTLSIRYAEGISPTPTPTPTPTQTPTPTPTHRHMRESARGGENSTTGRALPRGDLTDHEFAELVDLDAMLRDSQTITEGQFARFSELKRKSLGE